MCLLEKYKAQPGMNKNIPDIEYTPTPQTEDEAKILNYSIWYGKLLHQKAPGYSSNLRQQRMAGLATLQIAQTLRDFWCKYTSRL